MTRLAVALSLGLASLALADLIADDEAECRNKPKGTACRLDTSEGVCADATCTRNDYSEGVPPKRKAVPCLKCAPKPAADAGVAAPDAGASRKPTKAK